MRNGNLAGLLAEQASEAGWYDRPAFYAADVVTHGQIHDGAARLGEVLRNRGLSSGDRVLLCLPDSPDLVQLLLACLARGVMAFLANPELHRDDHALAARNTEPALVVTSDALRDRFQPSRVAEAAELMSEATSDLDLSMFALCSSIAATVGSPGQGNYSAANAFLDGLAAHRQAAGLAGISLAWGLWEQPGGMTAHLSSRDLARMSRSGLAPMSPAEAVELFDAALAIDHPLAVATLLDRAALDARAQAGALPALFSGLARRPRRRQIDDTGDATSSKSALAQRLHGLAADEQLELLVGLVCLQAAAVLGRPSAEDVDPDTEFGDLGFDSLTAVELRNRLKTATGLTLPPTVIFDHPTPTAVAEYVAQQMSGSRPTESGDPTSQVVEPAAAEVSVHA